VLLQALHAYHMSYAARVHTLVNVVGAASLLTLSCRVEAEVALAEDAPSAGLLARPVLQQAAHKPASKEGTHCSNYNTSA
jgi:hypothetical protein